MCESRTSVDGLSNAVTSNVILVSSSWMAACLRSLSGRSIRVSFAVILSEIFAFIFYMLGDISGGRGAHLS